MSSHGFLNLGSQNPSSGIPDNPAKPGDDEDVHGRKRVRIRDESDDIIITDSGLGFSVSVSPLLREKLLTHWQNTVVVKLLRSKLGYKVLRARMECFVEAAGSIYRD
ncbi:hypothetical protein GH714_030478 [Hevea brasiliensis]|uniref:Uncharacterized protein n=1 Tax=Hevea brasiliensis TaxID=3981 RepID=A0A6A6KD14_HEVBR|nr:hypothetical protein GH714_030478 [Hevea brasiliensis]